jgi:hypothetical protein
MMYIYLYHMNCPVRCLRAIVHDPSKCLKACPRFLTLLAVTPLPPPLAHDDKHNRPRAPPDAKVPRQLPQGPAGHNGALPASTGPRQMPQINRGPARQTGKIGRAGASSALGHRFEPCHRLFLCCCPPVLVTNLWSPAPYFSCSKAPSSLGGSGSDPQGDCPMWTINVDRPASQREEMAAGTTAASQWEEWRTRKLRALLP